MKAAVAIEPLHERLRAAAFNARGNARLSALLLEAAAAVPWPKGGEEPRRDTMAILAAHAAATTPREAEERARAAVAAYREGPGAKVVAVYAGQPALPAQAAPDLVHCGHCGEEFARGPSHCPECSGRVA